jgi:hypothetical protein
VQVVHRDLRELGADLLDEPGVEPARVDQHVVLVHEGELLALPLGGQLEGVAHQPADAVGGVQGDLGGDLGVGAPAQAAAVARVGPLGALADHHEVDLPRVRERARGARVELGGAEVDVVVEAEAQLQQDVPLQDPRGHALVARGGADRAEEDRVVRAQLLEGLLREGLPRREPVVGADAELPLLHGDAGRGGHGVEDLLGLGHDLRADAVAGDDGDLQVGGGCCGGRLSHAARI